MKFVSSLPWELEMEDHKLDAALFAVDESGYKCEFSTDEGATRCHSAPFAIGTSDSREPKFCLKHYFEINDGDGKGNYKIVAN